MLRTRASALVAGLALAGLLLPALALPSPAAAFCGFYVGGADASLYNDATMVVMMREGTTTVLSMQNTYEGPPEGFAMVVPVPEVLDEEHVRTLPQEVFERVDSLAAPRLVEYWEQDPCYRPPRRYMMARGASRRSRARPTAAPPRQQDLGVTVEAEFAVGEYDIVILSARESMGLETWLHQEQYAIPAGAAEVLDPYVQLGTKFFVAKVDPERVTFEGGRALLSPLRVHYTSETFSLPVRLGLLNSRGQQDLIVHVLAKQQRYEVANYPNVPIPTNLVVEDATRERFGSFYRALFDRVREENPGAVVTEYSWRATSCDPCPTTPLQPHELAILGADVIEGQPLPAPQATPPGSPPVRRRARRPSFGGGSEWTLTRLHHRYGPDDLDRDLVFRAVPAIVGGRGMPNAEGELQEKHAVAQGGVNNFQGRYVILHRWEGAIECENPQRGRWGGPPGGGGTRQPVAAPSAVRAQPEPVADVTTLVSDPDERYLAIAATPAADTSLGVLPAPRTPQPAPVAAPVDEPAEEGSGGGQAGATTEPGSGGCASCSAGSGGPADAALVLLGLGLGLLRRRSR
ncbi:MAG TPA: DUF2330 domain-containing protein [Polyangiaceae bacterium LLY-WYZ-15_(1-7)]|nr:DUF2330 domain-containing protein [Polyangiaceae bacterium LLY-WYZ-15_(1-7)]